MPDATIQLEIKLENGQFKVSSKQVKDGIKDIEKKSVSSIGRIKSVVKGFLALSIVTTIIGIGKAVIGASAKMETLRVAFETLLGSADKAKSVLEELRDFASSTPLQFEGLAESTKTLLNFGIAGDEAVEIIKMLGDVSSGNQAKLDSLALAFGQMSSTGRLMGQDLLQMINAGFNPLQEISEKTGVSMAKLKDQMSSGQISVSQVKDAFRSATSEGGRFFGMLNKQSQTLSGKFSTLKDNIQQLAITIGDALAPAVKKVVDLMTDSVRAINDYIAATQKLAYTNKVAGEAKEIFLEIKKAAKDNNVTMKEFVDHYSDIKNMGAAGFFRYNKMVGRYMELTNKEMGSPAKAAPPPPRYQLSRSSGRKEKVEILDPFKEFRIKEEALRKYQDVRYTLMDELEMQETERQNRAASFHESFLNHKLGLDTKYAEGVMTLTNTASIFMAQKNKKLFRFGQVLAIGQAWINTFLAVTKVLAQLGIFGPAAAGVIMAAGVLQTKNIAAQKAPEYETGEWKVPQTGPAIIHKDEMVLNKSLAEKVRSAASGQGAGQTIVNNYMVRGDDFVAAMEKRHQENADLLGGNFINYNNVYS